MTLHQATLATKKIAIGIVIGVLAIIFITFVFKITSSIKEALFPTPDAPANLAFGKLTKINFPDNNITGIASFTYALNTLTGSLPTLPNKVNVYKLEQPQPNLLAFNKGKDLATHLNFLGDSIQVSDSLYRWENSNPYLEDFIYNTLNTDFDFVSNYFEDQNIIDGTYLPDQQGAIVIAKAYLADIQYAPGDIDDTKTQTTLLALQDGSLIPAISLSKSNLIRVNFYQQNVNKMPILYPQYPNSLINFLVGSGDKKPQIVEVNYSHRNVLTDTFATYPVKTVRAAFNELKNGKAYIANYDGKDNSITIRNAYLGYYIGKDPQNFLMPIIVFQGDNNFYAYSIAIPDQFLGN